ncbi:helix-turn-helix domain-containing protein [Streptomyces sp. NPDC088249]|uniref:helix-turn-helix domain-containing protein n=1 Tax=Streptomyces sp. NPDC088249 TaxID=3365843 RepID=UPI003826BE19
MGLAKAAGGAVLPTVRLTELLRHARVGPDGAEAAARRTTIWLARTLGGTAEVVRAGEADRRPEVRAVVRGELGSAVVSGPGGHTRVVALGGEPPFRVLVITRSCPLDGEDAALAGHAAVVLDLVLRVAEAEAERREWEVCSLQLRSAVLQLLMGGDVVLAQRTAAGMNPGLLDADWAWMALLEMPVAERAQVARDCAELTAGRALVVPCPAFDNHVIVVVPVAEMGAPDCVGRDLSDYVARHPRVILGRSHHHALAHVATAYDDAYRNLVAARHLPARRAGHTARTEPMDLLPTAEAARWASHLLRPLDALPARARAQMLSTMGLALRFTAVRTAKIMGVSRNTVRSRMERAGELLGVNPHDVHVRTALYVALQLEGRPTAPGCCGPVPDLPALIGTDTGRAWARDFLGPLDTDARDLHRTLRAWICADCGVEAAAERLGLHPQTVREHLRSAEALLGRELTAGGPDVYEAVLAFLALESPTVHA